VRKRVITSIFFAGASTAVRTPLIQIKSTH
jgi:hypothetical protein